MSEPPVLRTVRSASALLIGNELLSGKIQETNLQALAGTLRQLGIPLVRVGMVPDDPPSIVEELNRLRQLSQLVITSGGIGPTHDDITVEAVARAFGVPVYTEPRMTQLLRDVYKERFSDAHLRMALVPEGAELVTSRDITWPTIVMANVWLLPGLPEVFRTKLMVLRAHVRGERRFFSREVNSQLDEGELKPHLDQAVLAFPEVEIGSYPKWFDADVKTKITFDGGNNATVNAALEYFCSLLPDSSLLSEAETPARSQS